VLDATLNDTQAHKILRQVGGSEAVRVIPIAQHNHVWRLEQGATAYFLKSYTKDWYGRNAAKTGFCVAHEVASWAALQRAGLAVPVVAGADEGCDNPLGRPFLLTRALRGEPLTDILRRERSLEPLEAVGRYLGRAHAIAFAHPGYSIGLGPQEPLREGAWQHRCWSAAQRQRHAVETLDHNRDQLTPELIPSLELALATMATTLAPAYDPPHFVHGDCHAHQFFLYREEDTWQVAGVIDMEVSSAGDSGEDFLHLFSELATVLDPATRWWETFFSGYGHTPSFEFQRLRFLGTTPAEYAWLANRDWPQDWDMTINHFLKAGAWADLFSLPQRWTS